MAAWWDREREREERQREKRNQNEGGDGAAMGGRPAGASTKDRELKYGDKT